MTKKEEVCLEIKEVLSQRSIRDTIEIQEIINLLFNYFSTSELTEFLDFIREEYE